MGFTYLGPIDGHNFDSLLENIRICKKTTGPVLLHVITKKGKGYKPAEKDTNWYLAWNRSLQNGNR